MIYLYTKNYYLATDSNWLNRILEISNAKRGELQSKIKVISWAERTWRFMQGQYILYDPPKYYYLVKNGHILKKRPEDYNVLIYPPLYKSKPVRDE